MKIEMEIGMGEAGTMEFLYPEHCLQMSGIEHRNDVRFELVCYFYVIRNGQVSINRFFDRKN